VILKEDKMSTIRLAGPDMVDVFTGKVLFYSTGLKLIDAEKKRIGEFPRKCYIPIGGGRYEAVTVLDVGIGNGELLGLCLDSAGNERWRRFGFGANRARLNRPHKGEVILGVNPTDKG